MKVQRPNRRQSVLGVTVLAAIGLVFMGTQTQPFQGQWARMTGADPDRRILVSLDQRRLWLVQGRDTIFTAPVAVGSGQTFTFNGRTYRFETPRGTRRVLARADDPHWAPPDWHYYEKASQRGLTPVHLERGQQYPLADGTYLEIRGENVGRVNQYGNFYPWTPGMELIFDDKIYIPPFDTRQRLVPNVLGPHKLVLGDGYLIHGVHDLNETSIGQAVSHGCIRMNNDDLRYLYALVDTGTPVDIF